RRGKPSLRRFLRQRLSNRHGVEGGTRLPRNATLLGRGLLESRHGLVEEGRVGVDGRKPLRNEIPILLSRLPLHPASLSLAVREGPGFRAGVPARIPVVVRTGATRALQGDECESKQRTQSCSASHGPPLRNRIGRLSPSQPR